MGGEGMSAQAGRGRAKRAVTAVGAAVAAPLLALLLLAPSASADGRIGELGGGAGQFFDVQGLAISHGEGGDVYVADRSNRVDQFDPTKPPSEQFLRAFGWDVNAAHPEEKLQVCTTATGCKAGTTGSGPGQLNAGGSESIAIDNSCAEHEPPLDESTTPKCSEFDPSNGDVYVADRD